MCTVCVRLCTCTLCMRGCSACVHSCNCMHEESPCQKHSCLYSDVWFHSMWSIYLENEQFTFSPCGSFLWQHPSFTPLSLSLSFNALYLIISSSPAVWLFPPVSNCARDTTWSLSQEPQLSFRNAINPNIPISFWSETIRPLSSYGV